MIVLPVIWFTGFRSAAEPPSACEAQYDSLVKQAQAESYVIVKLRPRKMLPRPALTRIGNTCSTHVASSLLRKPCDGSGVLIAPAELNT